MSNDLIITVVLFLFGQLVTGAAIWGAIRSDIRNMMIRMNDIKESSDHAHKRIDDIFTGAAYAHRRDTNGG